jgi:hypothetical protein
MDAKNRESTPTGKALRAAICALTLCVPAMAFAADALDECQKNHFILDEPCKEPRIGDGTISAGYTGTWSDPQESAQRVFIQVLPDNRFFAAWASFNPEGTQQAWFSGIGSYSGKTATITAVEQPTGGRWIPNFDPARVAHNPWGTLTFTFTDCYTGRVEFNSATGYGAGGMDLVRTTMPAGLTCR